MDNTIEQKSFDFAIRIVNLYKYLMDRKKEKVMSRQLLKAGTSIGANVAEAEKAQSKADFYSKMCIALKESNETLYWVKLLNSTGYMTKSQYESVESDLLEIIKLLTAICKTSQI